MSPKEKEVEEPKNMQQATIIVGFPGIGKSTLKQNATAGKYQPWNIEQILDEPNYAKGNEAAFLAGLRELAKEPDTVLLLPAHRFIGDFLIEQGFAFSSVYPRRDAKEEYRERYVNRGSHPKLIETVCTHWDQFITSMNFDHGKCNHFELAKGQYLNDIFSKILKTKDGAGLAGPKALKLAGK